MPRTDLTVEQMDFDTGLDPTKNAADATNDHSFTNTGGDVFLYIENGGTGACNVTMLTPQTITSANLTVEDRVYTIGAGADLFLGPFPTSTYNQTDGKVYFDLDVDTSVTIAVVQHGPSS